MQDKNKRKKKKTEIDLECLCSKQEILFDLCDMNGKIILTGKARICNGKIHLPYSLSKGIYQLVFICDDQVCKQRIEIS